MSAVDMFKASSRMIVSLFVLLCHISIHTDLEVLFSTYSSDTLGLSPSPMTSLPSFPVQLPGFLSPHTSCHLNKPCAFVSLLPLPIFIYLTVVFNLLPVYWVLLAALLLPAGFVCLFWTVSGFDPHLRRRSSGCIIKSLNFIRPGSVFCIRVLSLFYHVLPQPWQRALCIREIFMFSIWQKIKFH